MDNFGNTKQRKTLLETSAYERANGEFDESKSFELEKKECQKKVLQELTQALNKLSQSLEKDSADDLNFDEYILLTHKCLENIKEVKRSKTKVDVDDADETQVHEQVEKNSKLTHRIALNRTEEKNDRIEERATTSNTVEISKESDAQMVDEIVVKGNCDGEEIKHSQNVIPIQLTTLCNTEKRNDTLTNQESEGVNNENNYYNGNCNVHSEGAHVSVETKSPFRSSISTNTSSTRRTYLDAVLRRKRSSPKRAPLTRLGSGSSNDVEATRHASALRSEERQRRAEERRLEHINEIRMKSEAAEERSSRARARREAVEERQRVEAENRMECSLRRVAAAREQTISKAHRAHSRVDEVRFTNELKQQTKMLLLDRKMSEIEHMQEQKREERQRVIHEHEEAAMAAAERRRFFSQERIERQQQREMQRQETLRRAEEQRQKDLEVKQQRLEEWEKKVHQHHIDANAETEALSRRVELKLQASAQLREEQREQVKKKLEVEQQRHREAQMRRERKSGGEKVESDKQHNNTNVSETQLLQKERIPEKQLPHHVCEELKITESNDKTNNKAEICKTTICYREDEVLTQRINKFASSSMRQSSTFVDNYKKECLLSPKDLNRSRLRPFFSRLSTAWSNQNWNQCNQPLNSIESLSQLSELDYEYVRYNNGMDLLSRIAIESGKCKANKTVYLVCTLLCKLLTNKEACCANIEYFVKSGCDVLIALSIREFVKNTSNSEAKRTKVTTSTVDYDKNVDGNSNSNSNNNVSNIKGANTNHDNTDYSCEHYYFTCEIVCMLVHLLTTVLSQTLTECQRSVNKMFVVRDQLLLNFEVVNFYCLCNSILQLKSAREEEVELIYSALHLFYLWISAQSKRKINSMPKNFLTITCTNLLTLLQFIVNNEPTVVNICVEKNNQLQKEEPNINAVSTKETFSCITMWLVYLIFHTLNILARWQLVELQKIFHDRGEKRWLVSVNGSMSVNGQNDVELTKQSQHEKNDKENGQKSENTYNVKSREENTAVNDGKEVCFTRMELYNILSKIFAFFADNSEYFEVIYDDTIEPVSTDVDHCTIPPCSSNAHFCSSSFNEATRFGVAHEIIPPLPELSKRNIANDSNGNSTITSKSAFLLGGKRYPLRATLHEVLLLIGYVCLDDEQIQEIFSWGESRSLVNVMINMLPGNYFSTARHIFFPTLLSLCVNNTRNIQLTKTEIDIHHLYSFLKEEYDNLSKKAKIYANTHHKLLELFRLQNSPRQALLINIKNKSWAELTDDDDDFDSVSNLTQQSSLTVNSLGESISIDKKDNSGKSKEFTANPNDEKEKMCKLLKMSTLNATDFYRVDLRIPIVYWPGLLQMLKET